MAVGAREEAKVGEREPGFELIADWQRRQARGIPGRTRVAGVANRGLALRAGTSRFSSQIGRSSYTFENLKRRATSGTVIPVSTSTRRPTAVIEVVVTTDVCLMRCRHVIAGHNGARVWHPRSWRPISGPVDGQTDGRDEHPVVLNRPGIPGGSIPWNRGWSHAEGEVPWEADDASVQRW